jgi:hypothetical protein
MNETLKLMVKIMVGLVIYYSKPIHYNVMAKMWGVL